MCLDGFAMFESELEQTFTRISLKSSSESEYEPTDRLILKVIKEIYSNSIYFVFHLK